MEPENITPTARFATVPARTFGENTHAAQNAEEGFLNLVPHAMAAGGGLPSLAMKPKIH
jgi:hypothetical protein